MDRNGSGMTSPPVPDILINGAERPEDVDIASIGRLPSLSAASPVRSSPEATSIGVDGLFAKFGVKEVRSIAVRGRAKAESKREELRTMVGERYRDLLGAADSIVRMRKSSSVLLDRLARARQECDRDAMLSRAEEQGLFDSTGFPVFLAEITETLQILHVHICFRELQRPSSAGTHHTASQPS